MRKMPQNVQQQSDLQENSMCNLCTQYFFRVASTHNICMRKFADKLKELRKENEWTQKEMADRLQITRASVASWETNRAEPSLTDLCRIARLFDESTDYLLCYDKGEERMKKQRETGFDAPSQNKFIDGDKTKKS